MNVPNLDDSMDANELMTFWLHNRRPTKAQRFRLFGQSGKGTILATKALANYASNKATAMQCRERGDIATAQMKESAS